MRLVRARSRIVTKYQHTAAILAMDAYRWERICSDLASLRFDPVLDDIRAEDDARHLEEAERLAALVATALGRLARHLAVADG